MTKPLELFKSIHKSLEPHNGVFITSFSNRMFPPKVIEMWLRADCAERAKIVASYYHFSGFSRIEVHDLPVVGGEGKDPLTVIVGYK